MLFSMVSALQTATLDIHRRVRRVQTSTVVWMSAEAALSLFAAWRARSLALFAFGGDSAIELLPAVTVLWGFRVQAAGGDGERRAAKVAGGLLFALAVYVVAASVLSLTGNGEARPTLLGMAVLVAAAVIMPWVASEKRKLSASTGSAALRAESAQSGTCAYLSVIALVGLVANAIWHVAWADPVAELAIVPFVAWEACEAIRGEP